MYLCASKILAAGKVLILGIYVRPLSSRLTCDLASVKEDKFTVNFEALNIAVFVAL